MSPSRRVLVIALCLLAVSVTALPRPAAAQFYDPALRALDLSTDPVGRSPRLLGMGKLSLAIDDPSYKFDLWDYAQNPLGIFEDDSVSTAELWVSTGAASSMRDLVDTPGERQTLAGRANDIPLEIWRRSPKAHSVYGLVARLRTVRQDSEFGVDTERRREISSPSVMPVFSAPFPWIGGGRLSYALRMHFGHEVLEDQYRFYVTNPAGQSLDLIGLFAPSPNLFEPDEYDVVTQGFGGGLGYAIGGPWKLALMGDMIRHRIAGTNERDRSSAETQERRPYGRGQASLTGRLGALELAADGRAWKSTSEQSWRLSMSAGSGAEPLTGRGKLLEREEQGTSLDGRARWRSGRLTLGASALTRYGKVDIAPPAQDDPTSLNAFLNRIYTRTGVDTLLLPDSVVANSLERHASGFGAGAGWEFSKGVLGVEYNWSRDIASQDVAGSGPRQLAWDVRGGLEYRCNPVLTGRVGYVYRWADADDFTLSNEWIGHTATLGLGLHPAGTTWVIETGYAFQWEHADFGDPTLPHANRHNLSTQLRWMF